VVDVARYPSNSRQIGRTQSVSRSSCLEGVRTFDRVAFSLRNRSGSIEIEDPEEVTIESNPQLYPSNSLLSVSAIVKHGKLELDRCPLDKLMNMSIDVWGTGQLTVKTVYSLGYD
jgi:hypothetical protein